MAHDLLIAWLNDAYAMEQAQLSTLEGYIDDFERHPDIRSELRQHLADTKQQITDIKECIHSLDGSVQTNKAFEGVQADITDKLSTGPFHDLLVKDLQVLHATEHLEHISYLALAEAARHLGEDEIADICERIAEEEAAMAEWVEEQMPAIVTACLNAAHEEL